jgi:hypothetical protein
MLDKYDIPINFTVTGKSEHDAETQLYGVLDRMIAKYGLENLIEYEDFKFIASESCCGGCGDNNNKQREPTHSCQQACNDSSQAGQQSCCGFKQGELF